MIAAALILSAVAMLWQPGRESELPPLPSIGAPVAWAALVRTTGGEHEDAELGLPFEATPAVADFAADLAEEDR